MATADIAQKNGRGATSQSIKNSVDDVLNDARRLLDMVLMGDSPVDTARTGPRKIKQRATVAGQTPKRTSRERRRRSSSPLGNMEALKKPKTALEDDGSRHRDVDDDDGSRDHAKPKRDERPVEKTRRGHTPKLTPVSVGRRAPLAEPEDSTITPEAERDVGRQMRLLKCQSMTSDKAEYDEDDEVDSGSIAADGDYDDVDGDSVAEEPVDEKERILEEIAMKLRSLGDRLNDEIPLGAMTKSGSTLSISMMAIEGIQDLISNLTYEQFQDVVNRNLGNETGVQQVTVMFRLATAAVRHLGYGTRAATDLKQIALTYFRDNVATWVSQNGWEGIAQRL